MGSKVRGGWQMPGAVRLRRRSTASVSTLPGRSQGNKAMHATARLPNVDKQLGIASLASWNHTGHHHINKPLHSQHHADQNPGMIETLPS